LIVVSLDRSGARSRCPSGRLLAETNSPILVGLDLFGHRIMLHAALGMKMYSIGTKESYHGSHVQGYSMDGIDWNDGYNAGMSPVFGYQLIAT
jgi:hypothetical protein